MTHGHRKIWHTSFTFDPRDMLVSLHLKLYLKLVTIPSFCPFALFFLWIPLAMFVVSLVFSALIFILYLEQILSILSSRASSACSSPATALMSSANRRSVIVPSPILFFSSCSSRASFEKKMLKRVGERRQPRRVLVICNRQAPCLRLHVFCTLFD